MFFVDGFNLYHSIVRAHQALPGLTHKWLDLFALAEANLPSLGPTDVLAGVHYFTAYANHLALTHPQKPIRHRAYVRALNASGVVVHFGHFKSKDTKIELNQAHHRVWQKKHHRIWQEKATDVGIVTELFRQAHRDAFDTAVIVSGDADFAPALPVFRELHPSKRLVFAFPYDRKNRELDRLAPGSFSLSKEAYAQHQFPEAVPLPSGKSVVCPTVWRASPTASLAV